MTPRRLKLTTIVVVVLGAALGFASSTQTWYTLHLTAAAAHGAPITIPGSTAAPALTALSLASLALALAFAISGRIARIVLGVLGLIVAACLLAETAGVMAHPESASHSAVTTATGVAGTQSVNALVASIGSSAWPALALVGGVVIGIGALAAIVFGRRWPSATRRYEAVRWERVDDGDDDETGPSTDPAADGRAEGASPAADEPGSGAAGDRAVADWDELTRGDDPTR